MCYVTHFPEREFQCRSIAHSVLVKKFGREESREREGPSDHQRSDPLPGDREAEEVSNRRMHRSYQIPFYPSAAAAASAPRIIIFICNNAEAAAALLRNQFRMVPLHRNSCSSALPPCKEVLLISVPPPPLCNAVYA